MVSSDILFRRVRRFICRISFRYRAKIIKIFKDKYDSNEAAHVDLDFVDYGDTETREVSEICNLKIVSEERNSMYRT